MPLTYTGNLGYEPSPASVTPIDPGLRRKLQVEGTGEFGKGWESAGLQEEAAKVMWLASEAYKAGDVGNAQLLEKRARELQGEAQAWSPTVQNASDIDGLRSGADWLAGNMGNLRSSIKPALGGLAGAAVGTVAAPFTGGVINPYTGGLIGAGLTGYDLEAESTNLDAMSDEDIRATRSIEEIQDASRIAGAAKALPEALVPAGLGSALTGAGRRILAKEIELATKLKGSKLSPKERAEVTKAVTAKQVAERGAAAHVGRGVLEDAGTEGVTEMAQDAVDQAAINHLAGREGYDLKRGLNAAAAGAALGAPMGAAGASADVVWNGARSAGEVAEEVVRNPGQTVGNIAADLPAKVGELKAGITGFFDERAVKAEAKRRGVPPEQIHLERVQRFEAENVLSTPLEVDPDATVGETTEAFTQHDAASRQAADTWAPSVLADGASSPAEQDIAREHISLTQAGATNAHELTAERVQALHPMQEYVLERVTKFLGLFGLEPAPRRRGNAQEPAGSLERPGAEPMLDDDGRGRNEDPQFRMLRIMESVPADSPIRALGPVQWGKVDAALDAFAQGAGTPETRKIVDELFGSPETAERVLEMYREGRTATRGQDFGADQRETAVDDARDAAADSEGSDSIITDDDAGVSSGVQERGPAARRSYADGPGKDRPYFDMRDQAEAGRFERATVAFRNKVQTNSATVRTEPVGMVERELELAAEAGGRDELTPAAREEVELRLVNKHFPKLKRVVKRPGNWGEMSPEAQRDHTRRRERYERLVAKRVRALNNRYKTIRATAETTEGGGLDFSYEDIKDIELKNLDLRDSNASPTKGTLVLERSDAKQLFKTSAPLVLGRVFKLGAETDNVVDKGGAHNLLDLLTVGLGSIVDYSARARDAVKDYETRLAAGAVADGEVAPQPPKLDFTGRIGYVERGEEKWFNSVKDLPDNFLLRHPKGGERQTVGAARAEMQDNASAAYVEAPTGEFDQDGMPLKRLTVSPLKRRSTWQIQPATNHTERVAALQEYLSRYVLGKELVPRDTKDAKRLVNGADRRDAIEALETKDEKAIERVYTQLSGGFDNFDEPGRPSERGVGIYTMRDELFEAVKAPKASNEMKRAVWPVLKMRLRGADGGMDMAVVAAIRAAYKTHLGGAELRTDLGGEAALGKRTPSESKSAEPDQEYGTLREDGDRVGDNEPIRRDHRGFPAGDKAGYLVGGPGSTPARVGKGSDPKSAPAATKTLPESERAPAKDDKTDPLDWVVGVLRQGVPKFNAALARMTAKQKAFALQAAKDLGAMSVQGVQRVLDKNLTAEQAGALIKRAQAVTSGDGEPKANAQSAQTPDADPVADISANSAELKAAIAEIEKMVGPDVLVQGATKILAPDGKTEWSGEWTANLIRIAAGAMDKLGVGRHEALHQLFQWLRENGGTETRKILENVATNAIIQRRLKALLAEHPNAAAQLSDPEEAAAYAFQFWLADRSLLRLGPKLDSWFSKVLSWLDNIQLAIREKLGDRGARSERDMRKSIEVAEGIMAGFATGALADPDSRNVVLEAMEASAAAVTQRRKNVGAVATKVHNVVRKVLLTAGDAFENSDNTYVKEMGKLFFHFEGQTHNKQTFLEAYAQVSDQYLTRVRNALAHLDAETLGLAGKYLRDGRKDEDIHHAEAKAAVREVRKLLKDVFEYMQKADVQRWDAEKHEWVEVGKINEEYYPRVWSVEALVKDQAKFLKLLTEDVEKHRAAGGWPEIEQFHADTMAKAIMNRLINGQGAPDITESTSDLGITPFMAAANRRELTWLKDERYGEFMSEDVANTLTSYVAQAVKRAEYVRTFGNGGERIQALMDRAFVYEMGGDKVVEEAEAELEDAMKKWSQSAREALKAGDQPPPKPTVRSIAREILISNRAQELNKDKRVTAPESDPTFRKNREAAREAAAQEIDDLTQSTAKRLEPVVMGVMAMEGTLGHDIDPRLRQAQGAVTTYQNFRLLVPSLFSQFNDIMGIVVRGGTLDDAWKAFVGAMREIRLGWKGEYSQDELAKMAEEIGTVGAGNFLDAIGQTYSSQFMYGKLRRANDALFKWNGMEAWNRAMRIQATGAAVRFLEKHLAKPNEHSARYLEELFNPGFDTATALKADGTLDTDMPEVKEAVFRWVNGAILRPNASQRPVYASDPHYLIFYHLKQFAYSFHKVILRRAWIEAKAGNYAPGAALFLGYAPVSIAADAIRETLMPDDDPAWMKMGLGAYIQHGVARANLGGVPQMMLGSVSDPLSLFGPMADQIGDLGYSALSEDRSFARELAKSLPAGTLASRAVD